MQPGDSEWERLTINPSSLDCDQLLADWRWLVPKELRPFLMTLFGDWFFEDRAGRVVFLDTVEGKLKEIAPSREAFLRLCMEAEKRAAWLMEDLVLLCRERGMNPGRGQCLGFKLPPVLSGPLEANNVEVSDLVVYESITAQIHHGVKDMPPGTKISHFTVDGEEV
jgi:hypothetical protein